MITDVKIRSIVAFVAVMLIAAGLRFHHAVADVRFHSDEALYSTYARNAAVFGAWMLDGPVDKPPVSLYANALGQHFFAARINQQGVIDVPIRAGEFAAKMPNVYAGLIAVALVYALAWRLYASRSAALLAALMMAVAPFGIAYSASAFTDMLMMTLALGAILAALYRRYGLAGVLLALSINAKPQGVFFAPFVVAVWLWEMRSKNDENPRSFSTEKEPKRFLNNFGRISFGVTPSPDDKHGQVKVFRRHLFFKKGDKKLPVFIVSFALTMALFLLWDAARPETSVYTLGAVNISQDRFIALPDTWGERLGAWLTHAQGLLGIGAWTAFLTGVAVFAGTRSRINAVILLWCAGFFVAHWLGAFFTFDRYLLPLLAGLCLLAGWALSRISHRRGVALLLAVLIACGISGSHDPRADVFRPAHPDAYIYFAAWLNDKPLGTIIYDRWLGWEMGYYLGAWTDKRRVYYPSAAMLADDALLNPDPAPRYFIAPHDASRDVAGWLDALRANGFRVSPAYDCHGLLAYAVVAPFSTLEAASAIAVCDATAISP